MRKFKTWVFNLLNKRTAYRLGRALYMHARGDAPNGMHNNGEVLIQKCVVDAWQTASLTHPHKLVVFDVGAHVGNYSIALLQRLSKIIESDVAIYCFEPVPGTNATLRRNLPEHSPLLHIEDLALSQRVERLTSM